MEKKLEQLVAEQQANLDALLAFSKEMLLTIKEGDSADKLGNILAKRSKVLDAIGALGPSLISVFDKSAPSDDPRIEKLHLTIKEIQALDAECNEILDREKSGISKRMVSLSKGSAALQGYGNKSEQESRFISIKK